MCWEDLGRFGEAQAELEACLQVFQNDPTRSAKVLSSLAHLVLAIKATWPRPSPRSAAPSPSASSCPIPRDRAISHNNLASYLERSGTPSALAESPRHQLAALIYQLVAGLGQDLQTSLRNYAIDFRRAHAAGTPLTVPRVAELLADPAFHPLARLAPPAPGRRGRGAGRRGSGSGQARQAALEQE